MSVPPLKRGSRTNRYIVPMFLDFGKDGRNDRRTMTEHNTQVTYLCHVYVATYLWYFVTGGLCASGNRNLGSQGRRLGTRWRA